MKKLAVGAVVLAMGTLGAAACATTRAQTPATRPPLEVPPVPPRVIEPVLPPAPTPEPVGDLPPAQSTPPRQRPSPPRDVPQREIKTDPKPVDPPAAETAPPQAAGPPAATVPPLRTARTGDGVQAERQIRDIIARAGGLLGRVNYQKLSAERQKAYDQAKRFIEGAEGAIRDGKFEYAQELADKAETLAKELQG